MKPYTRIGARILYKDRGSEGLTHDSDPPCLGLSDRWGVCPGQRRWEGGVGKGQMASEEVRTQLADLLGTGVEKEFSSLLNKRMAIK